MIKRITVYSVLFLFVLVSISYASSFTPRKKEITSNAMLEYSLLSLKESAQNIADKNNWLSSEINKLRSSIEEAKKNFGQLDRKQARYVKHADTMAALENA